LLLPYIAHVGINSTQFEAFFPRITTRKVENTLPFGAVAVVVTSTTVVVAVVSRFINCRVIDSSTGTVCRIALSAEVFPCSRLALLQACVVIEAVPVHAGRHASERKESEKNKQIHAARFAE